MTEKIEVVQSPYDVRDYRICANIELPTTYVCPSRVAVRNQGSKPTCVAHALASLVEYHNKIQHKENRAFSTEFIYGTRDIGSYIGDGMVIRDALKVIQKYGTPYKNDCPGNNDVQKAMQNINSNLERYRELAYPHRVTKYYKCSTKEEIKTALIKHGPVVVSMTCYEDAKIVNDTYTYSSKKSTGKHCVIIYGYDERGWLIQNSWGTYYAGDGRFVMPYSYKFNEMWGVTDDIVSDDIKVKPRGKFIDFIYKIYNFIVNCWLKITDKT